MLLSSRPNQASIDRLFAETSQIRIFQCGMRDGEPTGGPLLLELKAHGDFVEVHQVLRIDETDVGHVCLCSGDLAVEFVSESGKSCTIGFHHHQSLRHPAWSSDARLKDGPAFARFLAQRGVPGPLEDYELSLANAPNLDVVRLARQRWLAHTPRCLAFNLSFFESHISVAYSILSLAYRDVTERCRVLLRWLDSGTGANSWSKLYEYHYFPKRLLERQGLDSARICVLESLDDAEVTRGAAKLFFQAFSIPVPDSLLKASPLLRELPGDFWDRLAGAFQPGEALEQLSPFLQALAKKAQALESSQL